MVESFTQGQATRYCCMNKNLKSGRYNIHRVCSYVKTTTRIRHSPLMFFVIVVSSWVVLEFWSDTAGQAHSYGVPASSRTKQRDVLQVMVRTVLWTGATNNMLV